MHVDYSKVPDTPFKHEPTKFQRPTIDISGAGKKRAWQWILPGKLQENDIVPDFGLIEKVEMRKIYDPPEIVAKVYSANGIHTVPADTEIWAFTYGQEPE